MIAQIGLFGGETTIRQATRPPEQLDMMAGSPRVACMGGPRRFDAGLEGTALQDSADREEVDRFQVCLFPGAAPHVREFAQGLAAQISDRLASRRR